MAMPDVVHWLDQKSKLATERGLTGEALEAAFIEHQQGQMYLKRHEVKLSTATFCATIDKYLAEMRFCRGLDGSYASDRRRACTATLRDIQTIERSIGKRPSCDEVVARLIEVMERQLKAQRQWEG